MERRGNIAAAAPASSRSLVAAVAAKQTAVGEAVPLAWQGHEEGGHACKGSRGCLCGR